MSVTDIPGDPGGLATLGARLRAAGGDVDSVQSGLGADTLNGAWSGNASTAFRASLGPLPGSLSAAAEAFDTAGGALTAFSARLAEFQSVERWCATQICNTQSELENAQAQHAAAQRQLATAQRAHAAAADPVSLHAAQVAVGAGQNRVQQASAAAGEFSAQLSSLESQASENHAEYVAAMQSCSRTLDSSRPARSNVGGFAFEHLFDSLEGLAIGFSVRARTWVKAYTREGGLVRGHIRKLSGGRTTWVRSTTRDGGPVRAHTRSTLLSKRWKVAGDWANRLGVAFGFGLATYDQASEDSHDKKLTTTDRVGRAAGAGVLVGGAEWAGAWGGAEAGAAGGALVGSAIPIVGTAVGATVGAFVGGVIGSGVAGAVADHFKSVGVDGGQWAANETVHLAHGAAQLAHGAGHVLSDLNPF